MIRHAKKYAQFGDGYRKWIEFLESLSSCYKKHAKTNAYTIALAFAAFRLAKRTDG